MKESMARGRKIVASVVIALGMTVPGTATFAQAGNGPNPGVLPPSSHPHGLTYGEWSARQWQWEFSLPEDQSPLFDTADCSAGQSGHVWFLGGTFAQVEIQPGVILGEATRNCTIPPGTSLFFPIVDAECSTIEGNGTTEQQLRDCARSTADTIIPSSLMVEVDGRSVNNLGTFRTQSPLFSFGPLPANNILGAPTGSTSPAVSDGYFVMLTPLSVGSHTIHFSGEADLTPLGGPLFIQDITYHITVAP